MFRKELACAMACCVVVNFNWGQGALRKPPRSSMHPFIRLAPRASRQICPSLEDIMASANVRNPNPQNRSPRFGCHPNVSEETTIYTQTGPSMGVHVPDHVEVSRFGAIRHSVALLIDLVELLQIFMEEESSENTLNLATRFATNALIAFGETPQLKESLNQELFNQEWFEFAKWLCGVSDSLSNARKIDQMYRDEMRQSCIPMIRTCKSLIEESENIKARRPAERWRELVAIFERTKSTYYDLINRHDILKEANESIERAEETS